MNYDIVAVDVVKKARGLIPIKGMAHNQIRKKGTENGNKTP